MSGVIEERVLAFRAILLLLAEDDSLLIALESVCTVLLARYLSCSRMVCVCGCSLLRL